MDSITYTRGVARNVKEAIAASGLSELAVEAATGIPRVTLRRRLDTADNDKPLSPFNVAELAQLAPVVKKNVNSFTRVKA